jgi:choline dehydrogenase
MEFDYVVVGGGTAGCVVAARLSEHAGARVLLLEAGGHDRHPLIHVPGASAYTAMAPALNWPRMTEPQPALNGRALYLAQGKVIGGSSTINGMVYTRGARGDYAEWVKAGAAGWGYDDVLPYFRKAENYSLGANAWHGADGPLQVQRGRPGLGIVDALLDALREIGLPVSHDLADPDDEGIGLYDWMVGQGRRSSTARAYLHPARARPNLTVETGAHATRLTIERGRATGVEYLRDGRSAHATAAREIILCGGALASPQLLMVSGIGPADHLHAMGIAPVHNLPAVGANLRNHLSYQIDYRCAAPITAFRLFHPGHGAVELLRYIFGRDGFLADGASPLGGFFRSGPRADRPDIQLFTVPLLLGGLGKGMRALLPREHGFSLFINQGMPHSTGTVRLRSADPLAPPLIDPGYLSDPRDLPVLIDAVETLAPLARAEAFRRIGAEPLRPDAHDDRDSIERNIRARAANHFHVAGTCRIGADAQDSVVDGALRVHGIAGLRVADASVMPRLLNANLAAPVIMIGERAADFIRSAPA